jgi:hypothetical protein
MSPARYHLVARLELSEPPAVVFVRKGDEWWWRRVRRIDTFREPGDDRLMTDFGPAPGVELLAAEDGLVGADEPGIAQLPAA